MTGATSGIGWKLVEQLIKDKKGVICVGRSDAKLRELERMIVSKGNKKYILLKKDLANIKIKEVVTDWN